MVLSLTRWQTQTIDPDSNSLDVLIGRIRRKLAPHALIHTERGRGYRLQHEHAGAALD